MPSTPYMKLYIGDYLGDTQHLSCLEHGAYILLIMAYWQNGGPLKNDPKVLRRLTRTSPKEFQKVSENVLKMFQSVDGMLVHKRVQIELSKREQVSTAARDAINTRWYGRNTDVLPTKYERNTTPIVHSPENKEEENIIAPPAFAEIVQKTTAIVKSKPEPNPLYQAIFQSFIGKAGVFTNYPKEAQAIKRIIKYCEQHAPRYADGDKIKLAEKIITKYYELTQNGDRFWRGQPFTPSSLSATGIFDRVLVEIGQEQTQEEADGIPF